MSQKIDYLRTKTHKIHKIVFDLKTQSWKNKMRTIVKGYDHVLNCWNNIPEKAKEELLDLSTYPTNPEYKKQLVVILKRVATDSISLKLLVRYYKMCLNVESTDKNIVLCIVNGSIFETNLLDGSTQPISLNGLLGRYQELFPHIKTESSEPTPISNTELMELLKQNYPLIEQEMLPDGSSGQFKNMV